MAHGSWPTDNLALDLNTESNLHFSNKLWMNVHKNFLQG